MKQLAEKKCVPAPADGKPKTESEIHDLLKDLPGWDYENGEIVKTFFFKVYPETVLFVNAVAWIADHEDHHPQIEFGYKTCRVHYSTHKINGLSDNDFICAAKIDRLL
ncbi:MAG: 4a-hydroxytetrahydrobiopterin dehydratase [Chitinivibrionales bacterium]|nr:4a-hydroxytetrahydrobiopterin dehydratase [Chitinivibrionales bacterium]